LPEAEDVIGVLFAAEAFAEEDDVLDSAVPFRCNTLGMLLELESLEGGDREGRFE